VIKGFGWSVIGVLLGAICTFFITPIVVRTLGTPAYGLYIFVLALSSHIGLIDLGLTWTAAHFFATDFAAQRRSTARVRYWRLLLLLTLLGIAAGGTLGTFTVLFMGRQFGDLQRFWIVIALATGNVVIATNIQLTLALLRGRDEFERSGQLSAACAVLPALFSAFAVKLVPTVPSILSSLLIVNGLLLSCSFFMCRRDLFGSLPPDGSAAPMMLREMFRFGGWIGVSRVTLFLSQQVDRLIVAFTGSLAGVGYYAVAANVANRPYMLTGPASALFFSRATGLHARNEMLELARQHAALLRILVWINITTTACLFAFGPAFLRFWLGPEFETHAGALLRTLTVGYGIAGALTSEIITCEACKHEGSIARLRAILALVAAVALFALRQRLSPQMVAGTISFWYAGVGIGALFICRRYILETGELLALATGAAVCLGLAYVINILVQPYVTGMLMLLVMVAVTALLVLAAGFGLLLSKSDRGRVVAAWLTAWARLRTRCGPASLVPTAPPHVSEITGSTGSR